MSKHQLDALMRAKNILTLLSEDEIGNLTGEVLGGYAADLQSRSEWEARMAEANKLALQVVEEKTFPWPNAANVKFPLVTVAALQYHARAYPALINGNDLVKCRVIGEDKDGQKEARAKRIGTHMSWQNLEQDPSWEEDHDKALLVQPIMGCAFIKRVYEPGPQRQISMLVLPQNFVINYYTKSIADSPRYTETFHLTSNNIKQRELDERFREIKTGPATSTTPTEVTEATDERQGLHAAADDNATTFHTGEQYCWYDLDGDGYQEPYIATFDIGSGQLRRLVARFRPSGVRNLMGDRWQPGDVVYKITPVTVYTKIPFIPSPDGGFYDLGLGTLLGPINATANTIINQMLDAGTMETLGGGFLGRGFKSKGGPITFEPGQWHPLDAPGDDLRKNVLPLPTGHPSEVLFKLLGLLIQYGERIASATDMQVGENIGQNTPAETARTMNDNGARVANAIHKRTWRAFRDEFRVQYDLNTMFIDQDQDYEDLTTGRGALITVTDYTTGSSLDVRPAADPHIVSDTQRIEQAKLVLSNAYTLQGHNKYEATLNLYRAIKLGNIEKILPPPMEKGPDGKPAPAKDFPPMPNPKMMEAQLHHQEFQLEVKKWELESKERMIAMQDEHLKTQGEVVALYAKAEKALADAKGVPIGHALEAIYAQIEAKKEKSGTIMKMMEIMQKGQSDATQSGGGGMAGMAPPPANQGVPQAAAAG